MDQHITSIKNDYFRLYDYLLEMDGNQISKLRKIVTGNLPVQAFTDDEIQLLEAKTLSKSNTRLSRSTR
jgi:hypothetical protein